MDLGDIVSKINIKYVHCTLMLTGQILFRNTMYATISIEHFIVDYLITGNVDYNIVILPNFPSRRKQEK